MRIRVAVLLALIVAVIGLPAEGAQFTAVGTVLTTGPDSLVIRIDDGGHRIPFAIERDGMLPPGTVAGSRVSVLYHPTGVTGQAADSVTLLSIPAPRARHPKAPAQTAPEPSKP